MKIIDSNTDGMGGSATANSRGVRNVLLAIALMMGMTCPFVWAYARTNSSLFDTPATLLLILFLCAGMAGAGAISVRVAHLTWWQTVLAAVLAGAGFMLLAMFKFSPISGLWSNEAGYFSSAFEVFVYGTLFISSPVFLLALFDPEIRPTMPALSIWKVVVTALLILIPFLLFDLAGISYGGADAGRVGREIGTFVLYILLFIATILVLRLPTDGRGPMLGSIGILLRLLFLIIWTVFGADGSL